MPIYEFECKKCGKVSSFVEKVNEKRSWFSRRKCQSCGSAKLMRIISTCSASFSRTEAESLNELSKMAPINFVQRPAGYGSPPPGGCPYADSHSQGDSDD